ncbi:MAG: hypothetical protein VX757_04755, partial [Planctomycetota bacterium]|nr:hypothetical protein [Planctomycetota bacterium]
RDSINLFSPQIPSNEVQQADGHGHAKGCGGILTWMFRQIKHFELRQRPGNKMQNAVHNSSGIR